MADTEDSKKDKKTKEEDKEKKSVIKRLLPLIILFVIVGLCACAGLGLGKILAGTSEETNVKEEGKETSNEEKVDFGSESNKFWYYDLEPPVVANLNEPGVTRYISASLTLQMNLENEKETRVFLDEKTPILRNWLYLFLSALKIENVQGDKNLKSIQSQICDGFNKELFPNSKPQIKQVLIREFPIQ